MSLESERILGLGFMGSSLEVLEATLTQNGLEVLLLKDFDLPDGLIKDGMVLNPKLLAEKITDFLKENKIITRKAVVLLDSSSVLSRITRLPHNLSSDEIKVNLEAETNQYKTLSGKEKSIDFKKIEEINEEGIKKINVLFVAAIKDLTGSYLKTAELSGLDLIGMDIPIFSVMRLLNGVDFSPSSLDVTLLIRLGENEMQMSVLKGNRPRFLYSVDLKTGDYDDKKDDFLERLVSAIRLVINFYQERYLHGENISRIIVSPLSVKFRLLHRLLQENLPQIPIQISNSLAKAHLSKEEPKIEEDLKFRFSSLIGAVLKAKENDNPFDLNLLSEAKKHQSKRLNLMRLLMLSLGFVLGFIGLIFIVILLRIFIIDANIAKLDNQIKNPSASLKKALLVNSRVDMLNAEIKESSLLARQCRKFSNFKNIAKAAILVPDGLWLTSMDIPQTREYLSIGGEAKTETPVFDYISGLSGCQYFSSVELISSKSRGNVIEFGLKCKIK